MTNLRKLDVSLTKHGAHKVATLLKQYEVDDVLNNLSGSVPGINIELAQARKNLSASGKGAIPEIWKKAKQRGGETIDALVLVGIIFSHHELISAMKASTNKPFSGRIARGKHIDGKAFTNFAHIIEELGYSTEHSSEHVDYDLHKLFQINGLNQLVAELLALKLETAGWTRKNSVIEESIKLRFHEVFSVAPAQLKAWLSTGVLGKAEASAEALGELNFFFNADDSIPLKPFVFRPGHRPRKTGTISVKPSSKESIATLLHNEIQANLFKKLVQQYGKDSVGTEHDTGQGTSIDVVVKTASFCWFYEIKTADSVKACIRQALPQLLEYAYWHGSDDRADRLIIVSQHRITKEAENYLAFLRNTFHLQIYYEQWKT